MVGPKYFGGGAGRPEFSMRMSLQWKFFQTCTTREVFLAANHTDEVLLHWLWDSGIGVKIAEPAGLLK